MVSWLLSLGKVNFLVSPQEKKDTCPATSSAGKKTLLVPVHCFFSSAITSAAALSGSDGNVVHLSMMSGWFGVDGSNAFC